jgi:hypothetical protein
MISSFRHTGILRLLTMPTTNYAHLEDDINVTTPSTKLLSEEEEGSVHHIPRSKRSPLLLQIILHTVLLSLSITFFLLSVRARNTAQCGGPNTSGECICTCTKFLLLMRTVKVVYEQQSPVKQRFDGSFDRSSPFKGPPSPAVDRAWDEVSPCMCC